MQKQNFSPLKYIKEKGKLLPIYKCFVACEHEDEKMSLTSCFLIKKQPSGKFTIAIMLVDRLCLGVKNASFKCNIADFELDEYIEALSSGMPVQEVSPEYFHNLVYGAVDYAADLGFEPHKDFKQVEYLLNDEFITDGIDEIEMGWKGKPLYIQGPYDNAPQIIEKLNRTIGAGNYDYIVNQGDFY